jgi:hypothetical protein
VYIRKAISTPTKSHDRAHRQVDVPRHDDQHHHGGQNADHRRLLRDVVEVLRRQEDAVRQHMLNTTAMTTSTPDISTMRQSTWARCIACTIELIGHVLLLR